MNCLYFLSVVFLFAGCDDDVATRVEGSKFSLELNDDWDHDPGQGFETFVGTFTDGVEEIHYDYGYFTGINLNAITQTAETVYYEETIIDGAHAKIVKKNIGEVPVLTLYIVKDDSDQGRVWIEDPSDDEFFISVFKSFRFL